MSKSLVLRPVAAVILASVLPAIAIGATPLSREETAQAIAFGQRCTAPIVRVPARRGQDFDVYVESPLARAALVVATATMMHLSIESVAVQRGMQEPHSRVWGVYADGSRSTVAVTRITLNAVGGTEMMPGRQQYERFFVGIAPSHGIIEPLRARFGEAVFDALPPVPFDVVFHTTAGRQTYHVTEQARSTPLRVCN